MNFGAFACLPPTRQRAMRRAWRGKIFEGGLEGLEPAGEACGVDQAIGRRRRERSRAGVLATGRQPGIRSEEKDAWRILRVFYAGVAQLREKFALIAEPEGGTGRPAALSDLRAPWAWDAKAPPSPRAPGRNDNEAPDGGFGGPQHPQHGAVEAVRNPPHVSVPSSPSMANRAAMIPLSASLLRLMAKSQSMCFLIRKQTGTYNCNRNVSTGIGN